MTELFGPGFAENPWARYAELRRDAPVHRDRRGFWVLTRHTDCLELLRSKAASADAQNIDPAAAPEGVGRRRGRPGQAEGQRFEHDNRPFLFRDPPEHTLMRGLVSNAFNPKMVEGLRPRIEAIAAELVAELCGRGGGDIVRDFAYPLPIRVICEMLGIPRQDQDRFSAWSAVLARGLDPEFLQPEGAQEERIQVLGEFAQYFTPLLAARRSHPGEDLLSRLVAAEVDGATLSEGQVLSTAILLLVAGHETTVNLISGSILSLIEWPEEQERWRRDPTIGGRAVEELLRFVSPVQLTGRSLLEDLALSGVTIPRGHFVLAMIGAANHDEAVFAQPERLDLSRDARRHLGFGFGVHHCLGAPLARLETLIALDRLLRSTSALSALHDRPAYRDNVVLRGLAALPVVVRST